MSLEFLTLCVTSTNTIKNDISTPNLMVIDAIKMISEIGNAYISLSRTNDSDNLSNYDMKCMLDSLKKYFELKIKDIYLSYVITQFVLSHAQTLSFGMPKPNNQEINYDCSGNHNYYQLGYFENSYIILQRDKPTFSNSTNPLDNKYFKPEQHVQPVPLQVRESNISDASSKDDKVTSHQDITRTPFVGLTNTFNYLSESTRSSNEIYATNYSRKAHLLDKITHIKNEERIELNVSSTNKGIKYKDRLIAKYNVSGEHVIM